MSEDRAVTLLRRTRIELEETRERLNQAEGRQREPIAIVGMGCRYPGGVRSPEDLWHLVSTGTDAISDLPDDRGWDLAAIPGPPQDPRATFQGGFIDGACDFDAAFFGIDDDEACLMDPQQRLLLETTWEAIEHAGIDPTALRGSHTGVFTGVSVQGYGMWLLGAVSETPNGYFTLGNSGCMSSGRLAHVLSLEGPAFTIDTACSSSAVALHVACQSLRQGDCSLAIAGGAAIIGTPWIYLEFSRQRNFGIAGDGRCKSFADGADGTVFSEGVGVVLLERLSDARRLDHEVLGVLRGSAYNQDGASNGLTAPNGLAHEKVIRQALSNASLSADQVDAVEGHGMGTPLGDPIEAQALIAAYGRARSAEHPLWLGSMKSNIGHTQSAGGVAGVIKMVMAMQHELLPRTLHVNAPSQHVDWSGGAVSLLTEAQPWTKNGDLRRAAIHSFGMSGTNVHLILEESPPLKTPRDQPRAPNEDDAERAVPWLLSGRGDQGLRQQARRLAEFAREHPDLNIADIGYGLAVSRPALTHRAFVAGTAREQILETLESITEDGVAPQAGGGIASQGAKLAFVCGAGEMPRGEVAQALMDRAPAFAAELERIDEAFADWSLRNALRDGRTAATAGAPDDQAHLAESLHFAVAASLAALWRACGVEPSAVVGHGRGELVAAYISGALTLENAVCILLHRRQEPTGAAAAAVPLWSASTGGRLTTHQLDDRHWTNALSEPARIDPVLEALGTQGYRAFVAIGSAPTSATPRDDAVVVSAVPTDERDGQNMLTSLAQLWVIGVAVDWASALAGMAHKSVRLPTYAFDRRRHWVDESPLWATDGPMLELRRQAGDMPLAGISPGQASSQHGEKG